MLIDELKDTVAAVNKMAINSAVDALVKDLKKSAAKGKTEMRKTYSDEVVANGVVEYLEKEGFAVKHEGTSEPDGDCYTVCISWGQNA